MTVFTGVRLSPMITTILFHKKGHVPDLGEVLDSDGPGILLGLSALGEVSTRYLATLIISRESSYLRDNQISSSDELS